MKQLERVADQAYGLMRIVAGFMFSFHGAQIILRVFAEGFPPVRTSLEQGARALRRRPTANVFPPRPGAGPMMLRSLLLLALLAAAPAGLAQQTSDQGQGSRTLEPGNVLHPLPTSQGKGDSIVVDWSVTDPREARMYFSFHEHVGTQQVIIAEVNQTSLKQSFTAPRDGLYSIVWQNNGDQTATFSYAYHVERAPPPAKTPFPAGLAVLAIAGAASLAVRRRG